MNKTTLRLSAPLFVKNYDNWFIFLLSYLYIRWDLLWTGSGVGVSLFTILFCGFFYLRLNMTTPIPEDRRKAARPWLFTIALSALSCTWFDASNLSWFTFLFLTTAFLYWAMTLSGTRILPVLSAYLPLELLISFLSIPFSNFGRFFGAVFRTKSYREAVAADRDTTPDTDSPVNLSKSHGTHRLLIRNLLMITLTLVILCPLFLIVLNLLAAADEEFMHMIAVLIDHFFGLFDDIFSVQIIETVGDILLAVPVACYLFGLLWAHTRPDHAKGWKTKDRVDVILASSRFVPRIMIYTALTAFSGIYLLFLALQASHLISALTGGLPGTTTYSAFARQGFFELCAVSFINLMVMTGTWLVSSRKQESETESVPPALLIFLAFLSFQTILLVITALVKMGLYIDTYGLTRLRVYTSWFMLWLLLIFAILSITHLRRALSSKGDRVVGGNRFAPAKTMTALTVIMFLTLSSLNVDALIVRDNLERYIASQMSLEELDLYGLIHLSDNAAMEVLDYYEESRSSTHGSRESRVVKEVERWISLVEPEHLLPREKAHLTVASLRLNHRLNTLKSQ